MSDKQAERSFFNRFLKHIPEEYAEDYHENHLRYNLVRSLFVDRLGLFFFIPLIILNILRWQDGSFERDSVYYSIAFTHFLLGFLYVPYRAIIQNKTALIEGSYPIKKVKFYLYFTIVILITSLLSMACFSVYERNSLAMYGVLVVLLNTVVVAHPKSLFLFNFFLFLVIVTVGLVVKDLTLAESVTYVLECAAFTIPVYVGAIFHYNQQIKSYLYEKELEKKNKIIEQSMTRKFERQIAEVEMKALRAQMNPHFLFNALNSIKLYVVSNESKTAALYLTKFSKLIRIILKNSKSKLVSLEDELNALELYIQMEQFRFDFRFDYEIKIDENVDKEFTEIPPMLLQPYVENAIWHGLMHKHDGKGELCIRIKIKDGNIEFIIEDNGIGRAKSMTLKSKTKTHESVGMKITANRLNIANKPYGTDGKLRIIDKENEAGKGIGTKVIFSLPHEEEE